MATSVAQQAPRNVQEELHPALAWIRARQKPLTFAIGAVLLIAIVGWYINESGRRKRVQAAEALDQARALVEAGNYPEASTQLQRVTQLFGGTDAALEAALALNQVRMLSGQNQLAVDELQKFIASSPPPAFRAAAQGHLGMALENTGKFAEAAEAYLAAAGGGLPEYAAADALLGAARSLQLAGDPKKAAQTLEDLIKRFPDDAPAVAEAKVRLSELTGGRI